MSFRTRYQKLVQYLLKWHRDNARTFPWRKTSEPYEILVAEIMLQRTTSRQVATIYESFLRKYPSLNRLAQASISDITQELRGLGLEYRAARLQEIARVIVGQLDGEVPGDPQELLQLPGVGNYIANAILCFAFGKNVPIVDANIVRIFCRVFSIKPIREKHKDKRLWQLAKEVIAIVPKNHCRDFNWGLLDLANLICTPKKPSCPICPLSEVCDYGQTWTRIGAGSEGE